MADYSGGQIRAARLRRIESSIFNVLTIRGSHNKIELSGEKEKRYGTGFNRYG